MDNPILQRCDVVCADVTVLPNEEFAMLRRNGFGASDAATFLGLYDKFRDVEQLIKEKLQTEYTPEEAEVGKKVSVRLGHATESLNLELASEQLGVLVNKDPAMYRIKEYPYLTISYDGLTPDFIPVEAKFVTFYGDKYYKFDRATNPDLSSLGRLGHNAYDHCAQCAQAYGIPIYYYAQLQQQMLGSGAEQAYLSALRSKDCKLYLFKIPRDEYIIQQIITEGYKISQRVQRRKAQF